MLLIPCVYIAAVLQTWIAARWETTGTSLNLLALTAFVWLIASGGPRGFLVASLVGLASDLGSSGPLGLGLAIYAVVGYGVIWLERHLSADRLPGQMGVLWLAMTLVTLLEGIAALAMRQSGFSAPILFQRLFVTGTVTVIIAVPIFVVVNWRRAKYRPMELVQASMN
jgi:cell shape-determining protein MreD